jgi:hypothetical protein
MNLRFLCLCAALAGCAASPPAPPDAGGWHAVSLPGKPATRYAPAVKDGRVAVAAEADQSASMWRRRVDLPASRLGQVQFSWWVQDLLPGADLSVADSSDAPARVMFAFAGDDRRLSRRNRMLFDLAEVLTGERPPYAVLMYVFGSEGTEDTVLVSHRTDRVRKIVVDAGAKHLRQWRQHRRDLGADYRRAFGEEPGALVAIALMSDSDNTGGRARAWYGPVELVP